MNTSKNPVHAETPGADTLRKLAAALALSAAVVSCGNGKTVEPAPPPDVPPRVVETFEPQTLAAEIEILTIDFGSAFQDPEGSPLKYSATSSDEAVLTVKMAGPVLTIMPLAAGSATVTVKAADPGGNSVQISIPVTVNPLTTHPEDDETYRMMTPFGVTVSVNQVVFSKDSSDEQSAEGPGSCIEIDPQRVYVSHDRILDRIYRYNFRFTHSRWQIRHRTRWITIPGTERNDNKLCTYSPTEYGLYRLVGDVIINDEDFRFSSNWLSH